MNKINFKEIVQMYGIFLVTLFVGGLSIIFTFSMFVILSQWYSYNIALFGSFVAHVLFMPIPIWIYVYYMNHFVVK